MVVSTFCYGVIHSLINTVFFGLQLEAYFSELGLFGHCEYFRLHRALIKH